MVIVERVWTILSVLLTVVAAVCLWGNNLSAAFVTATLGAVSWFLGYRAKMRAGIVAAEEDLDEQQTTEESNEN